MPQGGALVDWLEADGVSFTRKRQSYLEEFALMVHSNPPHNSMLAEGVAPCYCVALTEISND